ncbi:type I glyceraldehyde-3-phosphate dehydrogenase [Staphylococcus condimenti]|uniref:Glyceraldehyde-3-phosphate dehydrogenase n=2 Tax=Staphylococcus condimenti TaxID=70255 RepID=A0A143PAY4_9STAP|nr:MULTISPECIES: type I glyceraldehyde-3-phosphate dehydrogenase [Staphylococcus]AMY05433.1 type I glyceraldehyde-3-phosphate dehydrogenase [Staphylococcus condimenti]APR61639.1 type I glyceraldehyde-3-phosphate dehydrogenase [Staphylococcus condimenti]MDK8644487.1 type I glyceraldehyde-3-phosphate dehydrogenase [Staphylococcus condimenti]OFP02572.1 type I glyceraldehyde-3-phosphate dehydrogenase [Staphylococcus sp. HMSC065E08]PNZ62080.1 type I glyceraldehyde-3-phosphate dehydrogenase [Staphyl
MAVKVAINGFGRIGRLAFRRIQDVEGIDVVAVNDLTDDEMLAHLLKYDTMQGRFTEEVEVVDGGFRVNGKEVKSFEEPDASKLPWKDLDIDVVLECTGFYTSDEKAKAHIDAGAKKVLISAPATGDVKTIVYNVNQDTLDSSDVIVSGASCTTNSLAPVAQVLNDSFGLVEGFMTTIHAYTGDQNTQDGPHRKGDKRRARAAAENIVPNSTGAAKAIGKVIPEIDGKLDGGAQRVPVATGSLTELTVVLDKDVTVDEVNEAMKQASNESFGYNEDEIVSSDVVGMTFGSLFDATQTRVMTVSGRQLVKVAAWYDNEMSYTAQLVRTLEYLIKDVK